MSSDDPNQTRPLPKGTPVGVARYMGGVRAGTKLRTHPATQEEYGRLKAGEAERAKLDPGYVTAERASQLGPEALAADPMLAARVRESSVCWPENHLAASQAMGAHGDPPGGQGERITRVSVDAEAVFTGGPVGAGTDSGSEPGSGT